jgi:hypothetical protein
MSDVAIARLPLLAGSGWPWNSMTSWRRLITSSSTVDRSCTTRNEPVRTTILSGVSGLVDLRTDPDSKWTEIAERNGRRITLIILTDPGHAISKTSAQRILDQIRG